MLFSLDRNGYPGGAEVHRQLQDTHSPRYKYEYVDDLRLRCLNSKLAIQLGRNHPILFRARSSRYICEQG
jgi:hypothetical protein